MGRILVAPTDRVFALTGQNVTRMRTASNLLENSTTCASARLDGPGMGRSVDRTGTSMAGLTLICPVKRRDAAWTIVSTLQTLVKRTAMAMASAMLVTTAHIYPTLIRKTQTKMDWEMSAIQTRTTTEFSMSETTVH